MFSNKSPQSNSERHSRGGWTERLMRHNNGASASSYPTVRELREVIVQKAEDIDAQTQALEAGDGPDADNVYEDIENEGKECELNREWAQMTERLTQDFVTHSRV